WSASAILRAQFSRFISNRVSRVIISWTKGGSILIFVTLLPPRSVEIPPPQVLNELLVEGPIGGLEVFDSRRDMFVKRRELVVRYSRQPVVLNVVVIAIHKPDCDLAR